MSKARLCPQCNEPCQDVYCESCLIFTDEYKQVWARRYSEWSDLDDLSSEFLLSADEPKLANCESYRLDIREPHAGNYGHESRFI